MSFILGCLDCGGPIAPVLAELGSIRCHDCRASSAGGIASQAASAAWEFNEGAAVRSRRRRPATLRRALRSVSTRR